MLSPQKLPITVSASTEARTRGITSALARPKNAQIPMRSASGMPTLKKIKTGVRSARRIRFIVNVQVVRIIVCPPRASIAQLSSGQFQENVFERWR